MSSPRSLVAAVILAAVVPVLGACGSTTGPSPAAPAPTSSPATSSSMDTSPNAAPATVMVATTSLGEVVVDGQGRTLYMFTKDTKGSGTSACTGQCLTAWPPLFTTGAPVSEGVTGTLGTIDAPGGKKQVTLDGWPLYYFAKDAAPGDVKGQDVGSVWFVLDKTGTPVKQSPMMTGGY